MIFQFTFITVLNIFISTLFIVTVQYNSAINKSKRFYFFSTASLIIFICLLEFASLLLDGSPVKFRFFHILCNFLGFALAPLVPYCLAKAVYTKNKILPFFYAWCIYVLWIFITQFTGNSVFFVNKSNIYSRALGFKVYVTFYFLGFMLLIQETLMLSLKFKRKNNLLLFLNTLFAIFGVVIQIVFPTVHITWTCIIISTIMYYVYHDDILQQVDNQTGLFNYNSFIQNLKIEQNHCNNLTLIVIELDNFKKTQQNYNRTTADAILVRTANHIKTFYNNFGDCFRIGTDEFCVLIHNQNLNFKSMNIAFFKEVARESFEMQELPLTSLGFAKIEKNESLNSILDKADKQKSIFQKERFNYLYN